MCHNNLRPLETKNQQKILSPHFSKFLYLSNPVVVGQRKSPCQNVSVPPLMFFLVRIFYNTHAHTHTQTNTHTLTNKDTHTNTHTHTHAHKHTKYTHKQYTHTQIHTHIQTYTYIHIYTYTSLPADTHFCTFL